VILDADFISTTRRKRIKTNILVPKMSRAVEDGVGENSEHEREFQFGPKSF
jgi:hypothetical protein